MSGFLTRLMVVIAGAAVLAFLHFYVFRDQFSDDDATLLIGGTVLGSIGFALWYFVEFRGRDTN